MGDVLFSAANNPQTSNAARGDVNSVNLRSLGVGNTLVLLNGRRIVQHPTSQVAAFVGDWFVESENHSDGIIAQDLAAAAEHVGASGGGHARCCRCLQALVLPCDLLFAG